MQPITLEAAQQLTLHAAFWRLTEVKELLQTNPDLVLRHALIPVSKRRAVEWNNSLYTGKLRRGEIVLALQDDKNRFLLHAKSFYHEGVYRLITGGIHKDESVLQALHREALEETGLVLTAYRPLAVLFSTYEFNTLHVPFISYLFHGRVPHFHPNPQDKEEMISDFKWVDRQGLEKAMNYLQHLPTEWEDWGRVRALAHQILLEILPNS
jgi:8-oxo-dGTP pyrophosphatase MutT (NUDIX family)